MRELLFPESFRCSWCRWSEEVPSVAVVEVKNVAQVKPQRRGEPRRDCTSSSQNPGPTILVTTQVRLVHSPDGGLNLEEKLPAVVGGESVSGLFLDFVYSERKCL